VRALFLPGGPVPAFNPVAMVALGVAIAPNLPGFFVKVKLLDSVPAFFTTIYPYGWFTGVSIAFVVYALGMLRKQA
jgi:cytosine/uracil/thiamine/allantoin permease